MKEPLRYSSRVHFLPHVGAEYFDAVPKVLILGESVYESDDGIPGRDVAREMVRGVSTEEWNKSFFTRIHSVFSIPEDYVRSEVGEYDLDKKMFWNRVAFYEYVQEALSGARTRPTPEQWEKSAEPFREVIDKLEPDIIVALGYENYEKLPDLGREGITIRTKGTTLLTWEYNLKAKTCFVCRIQHPSSFGFKKENWVDLFENFLRKKGWQS